MRAERWRLAKGLAGPLLAVGGALAGGALLLLAIGASPTAAYVALLEGALGGRGLANLAATLARATPIVGMGLAAALAFRAGFFNLGGEGQLVLGGLAAALVALHLPLPAPLLPLAALLAAAASGGLWAWVAARFEVRFGVPLLVSTLLLNYPARELASYLVSHPLRDPGSGLAQTPLVPAAATLPSLFADLRLHSGSALVLALVLLATLVVRRTVFGYHLRLAGLNRRFVEFGGVDVGRLGERVMLASGAVAGLVGAVQVLAVHHRFIDGALTVPLWAWSGLMVALLAASRPLGVLLAGLFFAAVQTGALGMERATEVPRELSRVLQALIILLVAVGGSFRSRPAADGEEGA